MLFLKLVRNLFTSFDTVNKTTFDSHALKLFAYQYEKNSIYRSYCNLINVDPSEVTEIKNIPFLPIQLFKTHNLNISKRPPKIRFTSSKTTGQTSSIHAINDLNLYIKSFNKTFNYFYGDIENYVFLALLPSYLERKGSSLVYMADYLIKKTERLESGFYLNDWNALRKNIIELENKGQKTILLGVTFALLEVAEKYKWDLKNTIILETGGMKGMREEMVRSALHKKLKDEFNVTEIHSEYGMTELLSQAYSKSKGIFKCPPWMRVMTRSVEDPLQLLTNCKTGAINVIDLANLDSCAFIATQDLGKMNSDGSFEVLGRFDQADIRGCNLMVL